MDGDIFDYAAPIAGAIIGSALLPGAGTALGLELGAGAGAAIGTGVASGLNTGIKTGDPLAGFISGGLSGAGSYAGNILGEGVGDLVGGTLNATPAEALTLNPTNAISDLLNQQTIGSLTGSAIGSNVAQNVGSDLSGIDFNNPAAKAAPEWGPTRANVGQLPTTLSGLSGLSGKQQGTNIASQGVYGMGQGGEENQYFLNLINNRLIDKPDLSEISPIESSYLAQLGLTGYGNPNDLLKGIENYSA